MDEFGMHNAKITVKNNQLYYDDKEINMMTIMICLGHRTKKLVKAIHTDHGNIFPKDYPEYIISNDNQSVKINSITIDINMTTDTIYQCWPTFLNSATVSNWQFDNLLRIISFYKRPICFPKNQVLY